MPYPIDQKLVIAVASSALFDLSKSDSVYRKQGLKAYREYQREHEAVSLNAGVAFPLVRRLLSLNAGIEDENERPVEVNLLSKNDPDTGLRVFNSIETFNLPISRAAFVNGGNPYRYMDGFNASLFLSANIDDVKAAIKMGKPAGQVFPTHFIDTEDDMELRIAFDFDGVIADDSSEAKFREGGLDEFQKYETDYANVPLSQGPLARFFREIARLQKFERERQETDQNYISRLRTAIVTSRNAPAHKRVVTTLRDWDIEVDEVLFLGGIEKSAFLQEFQPHIFFDDQLPHVERAAEVTPCVHVPFGVANQPKPELVQQAHEEYEKNKMRATP
ncbi:MAG: 5'-nucleotidase [Candidatus Poribacteria bacterium]|nr:5'-nucleotidase [Candidatus Poribacteria bacterium]